MSIKKISQETFDEVVKENIEDFDMSQKDALKDATAQFLKQGVDLSNIDLSGGIGKDEIMAAIKLLCSSSTKYLRNDSHDMKRKAASAWKASDTKSKAEWYTAHPRADKKAAGLMPAGRA